MPLSPPLPAFAATALLFLSGCGAFSPTAPTPPADGAGQPPPAVKRLLLLMRDRLALMHEVARSKWNSQRPVSDPGREQILLREMGEKAQAQGLDTSIARAFFAAQINAAKRVQEADIGRWRTEGRGPFDAPPTLAALRQRIDGLNRELLGSLAEAQPQLAAEGMRDRVQVWAREILTGEGITDDVRAAAIEPLREP